MTLTDRVLARTDASFADAEKRWLDWLRIPSVSADPKHAADVRRAAEYAVSQLADLGFTVSLRETAGAPCVVGHHPGPGGAAPHLLYYGHYDVQPAEPLELWTSPPFEPVVVDGPHGPRVVARGAVDDKGQIAMWLAAFRAWHAETGTLPCRVSVLLEGEEEISSPNLKPFVIANRDELAADAVVISDTNMWDVATPALTTSLRGIVYMQVDVRAADRDLHSGMYGGSALNPINALVAALGQLKDDSGRIQIPGFYDGVREVSAEQKRQWEALGFDEARLLGDVGLTTGAGEAGRSALERLWARPTCDINGIWGGYQGPGSKTVIPAAAGAKVSFRLVEGQDAERVAAGFERFVRDRMPADAKLSFSVFGSGPGVGFSTSDRFVQAAAAALTAEYGKETAFVGCGASIPVAETLRTELGATVVLMGFGLDDDQPHSPNEKFEVCCFRHGVRAHARLLGALG
jgi:acetylornithine deacetylase/succinyl-diaminopimelate desuccinylase-like protein